MILVKSIQRLYQPSKLKKIRVVKRLQSFHSETNISTDTAEQQLSRDQVLEIYDWVAQLNAR